MRVTLLLLATVGLWLLDVASGQVGYCFFFQATENDPNAAKVPTSEQESYACKAQFGAKNGCRIKFKCNAAESSTTPGYYFEEDAEGDGIEATCENGKWTSEFGSSLPLCKMGCIALTDREMENATYVGSPPRKTYRNGAQTYWPQDTELRTKCKPGFIFTNTAFVTRGEDLHRCTGIGAGKGSGWKDLISDVDNSKYGWPGKCEAVCDPLDVRDIPNNVVQENDPNNDFNSYIMIDGVKKIRPGSSYQFKCKEGYTYPAPYNTGDDAIQNLQCIGGPHQYFDCKSKNKDAKPVACISNGCPDLSVSNINGNANVEYSANCGGASKQDGCVATIKCNKNAGGNSGLGYFMPNEPNGQKLTCKSGKWTDKNIKEVIPNSAGKYGGTCSAGCARLSADELGRTTVEREPTSQNRNDEIEYHTVGETMETSCKDNTIRPGFTEQPSYGETYRCTANGWENAVAAQNDQGNNHPGKCLPACEVPTPTPTGTKIALTGTKTTKGGKSYVRDGATVTVSCAQDYKAPGGSASPTQTLVCQGASAGWKDAASGTTNKAIMTCVRDGAPGCPLVSPTSNPNTDVVEEGNCVPVDGLVPENCKLTVKCKAGFIPDSSTPVGSPDGSQTMTCKAGNDGYVDDKTGQDNVAPLKCVPGCEVVNTMQAADYTKAPSTADQISYGGKKYLRKNAEVSIKCKSPGFDFNNAEDRNAGNPEITYRCLGGDDKYMKTKAYTYNKMPGDACGGVCEAIESNPAPGAIAEAQNAINSVTYVENSVRMVVNMDYIVKCQTGFEYPKGTPEAQKGYQTLRCVGGNDKYMDLNTNQTNAKAAACIRSEAPRCTAVNHDSTNTEVEVSVGNCTTSSAKTTLGCEQTIKCKNGAYPVITTKGKSASQRVKCAVLDNGETAWVDIFTNQPTEELKCEFGCLPLADTQNAVIVNEPSPTFAGGVAYHKQGATVTVRCKTGYVPRSDSGMSADSAGQNMDYTCNGAIPARPWRNNQAQRFEESPGSICVKPCDGLSANGEGVKLSNSPQELTTSTGKIVAGGSIYVFSCINGYHYADAKEDKNKKQELLCSSDTGSYVDLSNNNASVQGPTSCKKDIGPGCRDLVGQNSQMTTSNCDNGYQAGCKVTVQCKEGYIPSSSQFYSTASQVLSCPDGNDWVNEKGQKVAPESTMTCEAACRFDESMVNQNVVITRNSSRNVVVNGVTYMREADFVYIKCQGDGVIWENDVTESSYTKEYACKGGDHKYRRESDQSVNVIIGEGCIGTCKPLEITLSETLKVTKPTYFHHKGQNLVANGDIFTFQCADRYVYADGSGPKTTGSETVKCDGDTRKYVNAATGAPFTQPTACIRNPSLNECDKIEQNSEKTISSSPQCVLTGGKYFPTGCKVTTKCKPGYMPVDKTYLIPSGEQIITCGSGGLGWTDQLGNKVSHKLDCTQGCVEPNRIGNNTAVNSHTYNYYGLSAATCREIRIEINESSTANHPYICKTEDPDYFDSRCENACAILTPVLPQGVVVKKQPTPPSLSLGVKYIFGSTEYVLECGAGYVYPANDPHRSLGRQTLKCNGATNKYDDVDTGAKSATIAPCEESKGCKQLAKSSHHSEPTQLTQCFKNADYYNDGCQLKYGCATGFYPEKLEYLYENGQTIGCSEQTESWFDIMGNKKTALLTCKQGCAKIIHSEIYKMLNQTDITMDVQEFKDSAGQKHHCFSTSIERRIQEIIDRIYKENNAYFCGGTERVKDELDISREKSDSCPQACQMLSTASLPEGVVIKTTPATFKPYGEKLFTGVGNQLVFACADGYEYESSSVYAKTDKQQKLECTAENVFKDLTTGTVNHIIYPCKKVPSCPRPSQPNVVYTDIGCIASGNSVRSGCVLMATCANGSYPTQHSMQSKESQKVRCATDAISGSVWTDTATGSSAYQLQCTEGCMDASEIIKNASNNDVFTFDIVENDVRYSISCRRSSSSFSLDELFDGPARYYCGFGGDGTALNKKESLCTNACIDPTVAATLQVIHDDATIGMNSHMPEHFRGHTMVGKGMKIRCSNGKFAETGDNQISLMCTPQQKWVDGQGKEVTEVKDTCQ